MGHCDPLAFIKIALTEVDVSLLVLSWSPGAVVSYAEHHGLAHHAQQGVGVRDAGEEGLRLVITPPLQRGNLTGRHKPGPASVQLPRDQKGFTKPQNLRIVSLYLIPPNSSRFRSRILASKSKHLWATRITLTPRLPSRLMKSSRPFSRSAGQTPSSPDQRKQQCCVRTAS